MNRQDQFAGREGSDHNDPGNTEHAIIENAHQAFTQAQYEGLDAIRSLRVKENRDGSANIAGIPIPAGAVPVANYILNQAKTGIIQYSDRIGGIVYNTLRGSANNPRFTPDKARLGAYIAETAVRFGAAFSTQIAAVGSAQFDYEKEKKGVRERFRAIDDILGKDAAGNELKTLAYARASSHKNERFKWIATDLPSLMPQVVGAWLIQKEAHQQFKNDLAPKTTSAKPNAPQSPEDILRDKAKAYADRAEHKKAWVEHEYDRTKDTDQFKYFKSSYERDYGNVPEDEIIYHYKEQLGKPYDEHIGHNPSSGNGNEAPLSGYEEQWKQKNATDTGKENSFLFWLMQGGNLVDLMVKGNVLPPNDHQNEIHAPELIEHLVKELRHFSDNSNGRGIDPDSISISGIGHLHTMSLKDYLTEIFIQHERDILQNNSNLSYKTLLEQRPLADSLLKKLSPSIELIEDALIKGMDAQALDYLVGCSKVIEHGKGGSRTFLSEDKVRETIESIMPVMGTQDVTKHVEFLSNFEDTAKIQQAITDILALKGEERALTASLMPNDVLTENKIKERELLALHKTAHKDDKIYHFMAANTEYLAGKGEEHLKRIGVSDDDISAIMELAERVKEGNLDAVKEAVDGRDKTFISAVRNAALLEQTKGEKGVIYWSERKAEMGKYKDTLKCQEKDCDTKRDKWVSRTGEKRYRMDDPERAPRSRHSASRRSISPEEFIPPDTYTDQYADSPRHYRER